MNPPAHEYRVDCMAVSRDGGAKVPIRALARNIYIEPE